LFRIRKEHLEAFSRVAVQNYEDRMIVHLRKYFPDKCSEMSEAKTREFIQYGIRRAASYGIVGQRDVCLYIDLMAEFGRDFDISPSLPWASAILSQAEEDPSDNIDRAYAMGLAWNDESYGNELRRDWQKYL
jgi:hypothetical protein